MRGLLLGAGRAATAHAELRTRTCGGRRERVTTGGHEIDLLLMVIFWLTLAVFIVTQVVYIVFIVKYRQRKGVKAVYSHGNNRLETDLDRHPGDDLHHAGVFEQPRVAASCAGPPRKTR